MTTATTPPEFVAAQPGSWTYCDLQLSSHEAGHAVVAVLEGLTMRQVRIDRPIDDDADTAGRCDVVLDIDRLRAISAPSWPDRSSVAVRCSGRSSWVRVATKAQRRAGRDA